MSIWINRLEKRIVKWGSEKPWDFYNSGWITKDGRFIPVGDHAHEDVALKKKLVQVQPNTDYVLKAISDGNIHIVGTEYGTLTITAGQLDYNTIELLRKAFAEGVFNPNEQILLYWGSNQAPNEKIFHSPEEARDWVDNL
jgi:hypothetical protein